MKIGKLSEKNGMKIPLVFKTKPNLHLFFSCCILCVCVCVCVENIKKKAVNQLC